MSNQGNSDLKTCIFVVMMVIETIFPLLVFLGIMVLISRGAFFKSSPFSSYSLQLAFCIKSLAGLVVFYLYSEYYPVRSEADTFKYFDDSYYMAKAFWEHPVDYFQMLLGIDCNTEYFNTNYFNHMSNWVRSYDNGLFNDNRLIIRLNALFRIFSSGNYHVHSLCFNLIAFIGSLQLAKVFYAVSKSKLKSYLVVFLIPSVVFWSSGVFKESILIYGLGTFLFYFYQFSIGNRSRAGIFFLLFSSGVLVVMKLYIFAAFLPVCIAFYFTRNRKKIFLSYVLLFTLFLAFGLVLDALVPRYSFIHLIVDKQRDFINLSKFFEVNSAFQMEYLQPTLFSLLTAAPEALLNVFTKPWLSEVNSFLFVPPLIENLFVISLAIFCLIWRKKISDKQLKFVFLCFSFTLIVYLVIGLTTPITGALVRYKIPALPFLWMALLILINTQKFPKGLKNHKTYQWVNSFL